MTEEVKSNIGNVTKFNPPEKERIYYYPVEGNLVPVSLKDVTELTVRSSGTHRLKTLDKKYHIMPTGWLHIELIMDNWTV